MFRSGRRRPRTILSLSWKSRRYPLPATGSLIATSSLLVVGGDILGDWERIHRGNRYYWVKRDSRGRIIASRDTHPHPGGGAQCFVVSASGDLFLADHFRTWRDFRLATSGLGALAVHAYYVVGPILALFIRHFRGLRRLSESSLIGFRRLMEE